MIAKWSPKKLYEMISADGKADVRETASRQEKKKLLVGVVAIFYFL